MFLSAAALICAAAPGTAAASPNPGQVELAFGQLAYVAEPGRANDVSVSFSPDRVVVRDTGPGVELRAGAGCHPGASTREVVCTPDDSDTGFSWSYYQVATGDLDDRVRISVESTNNEYSHVSGQILGGDGADILEGGQSNDTLRGGPGADVLSGGDGDYDTADYGDHQQTVTADLDGVADDGGIEDAAGDRIAADVENLTGGLADDVLTGDAGANQISGGAGADVVDGGAGHDWVSGSDSYGYWYGSNDGPDTVRGGRGHDQLAGGAGADVFEGGEGTDTVSYQSHSTGHWENGSWVNGEGVTATLNGQPDDGSAADGPAGARDNILSGVENLMGSPAADDLVGNADDNWIDGGMGEDSLDGAGGADSLSGGWDGNGDSLAGGDGDDTLLQTTYTSYDGTPVVGDGADDLQGGDGVDRVDYSARQAPVAVDLDGVAGDDGQTGEGDTVGSDVENATGGGGSDTLTGSAGVNRLHGGYAGDDVIAGLGGDDRLAGGYGWSNFGAGDGRDSLDGGDGADRLDARDNASDASLACGPGEDSVFFDTNAPADPSPTGCEGLNPPIEEDVTGSPTATTDDDGAPGATKFDVLETTATAPDGTVTIAERNGQGGLPPDWVQIGQSSDVSWNGSQGPERELVIVLTLDSSVVPADPGELTLFDWQTRIEPCTTATSDHGTCLDGPAVTDADGDRVFRVLARSYASLRIAVPSAGRVLLQNSGGSGSRLLYTARDGEANDVELSFGSAQVTLRDPGASGLAAGPGCTLIDPHQIRCSREETGYSFGEYALVTGDGDDSVEVAVHAGSGGYGGTANVYGTVDGGAGNDSLLGGGGQDTLVGGPGADDLSGGGGWDRAVYGDHAAGVTVTIGDGLAGDGNSSDEATIGGTLRRDAVAGDIENLSGSPYGDTLAGDASSNSISGGTGSDVITGGGGSDWLDGEGGYWYGAGYPDVPAPDDDRLSGDAGHDHLTGGRGADDLEGGAGFDTVEYGDHGSEAWDPETNAPRPGEGVVVSIGAGQADDGNSTDADAAGTRRDDVASDVEAVRGSRADDQLSGDAGANRLDGADGSDLVQGGGGADSLSGGYDQVADTLHGGEGDDLFFAQGYYSYTGGPPSLQPDGAETVVGGEGRDRMDYSNRTAAVEVALDGAAGDGQAGENDRVTDDVEDVTGGQGNDRLIGSEARNRLHGGPAGDDVIEGRGGADRLLGGYGYSWSSQGGSQPGDGTDTLRGGAGEDTVNARDGVVDAIDCGTALDVAWSDVPDGNPASVDDARTGCESVNPQGVSRTVEPGGSVSTDPDGTGPSATRPVVVGIESPNGGEVTLTQAPQISQSAPDGVEFLDVQMNITAPDASTDAPLRLTFTIGASVVPSGGAGAVRVFRDGIEVDPACPDPSTATNRGCVASRTTEADGDVTLVVLSAHASAWNFGATRAPSTETPPAQDDAGGQPAGGTTPEPSEQPQQQPLADTRAPSLTLTAKSTQRASAALRKGVLTGVGCDEKCSVVLEVKLDRKTARRLGIGRTIGRGTALREPGGATSQAIKLTAKARNKLKRVRSVIVTVVARASDDSGNTGTAVARRVRLRR